MTVIISIIYFLRMFDDVVIKLHYMMHCLMLYQLISFFKKHISNLMLGITQKQ